MVLNFPKLNTSVKNFLRACGYAEFFNRRAKETSFTRNLDPGRFYPKFHIYAEESPNQIRINLHLDAKQPSYEGASAHSGEYEGPVVENEARRIKAVSEKFISKPPAPQPLGFSAKGGSALGGKKESWFKKLFSFLRKK